MSKVINGAGLCAVWRRQLGSLLGNPLGYIFILAFVVVSAAILYLPDAFFARNICDLGYLLAWDGFPMMPALLAIVVPALAMGAWSNERDSGTEELLLTMPMSTLDAVLGKYFAVVTFVTIALICSLSNVVVLAYIGDPDVGLLFANYLGWWAAACAFAAWSLFASVLVASPAMAFVVGALFSGLFLVMGWWSGFFADFNRGVIPVSGIIAAGVVACAGLAASVLVLAARRWRPGREMQTFMQCCAAVLALVLAVNTARIGNRYGVDVDASSDGIASLASESISILEHIDRPVRIAAFISQRLPESVQLKAKELEDRLAAIKRYGGSKVVVEIYRPKDALSKEALHAKRDYNLNPRRDIVESVVGKEMEEVFLSVAISSAGRTQLIEYVDPGVNLEYELVQAVRTVGSDAKRVIGVASTDMEIGPGFDARTQNMRQPWMIYSEWAKQYDVREVNLDQPVDAEVETLIVPQPSSLTQSQMVNLHDYIWAGRPCLLMEDPLPIFSGADLSASQPKRAAQQNPYGGQPPEAEPKGDFKPILKSLGIDFNLNAIVWSDYNPSHAYRGIIPRNFVWAHRDGGATGAASAFSDSLMTRGFTDLLFPFPGRVTISKDKPSGLNVDLMVSPTPAANWGWHNFTDHVDMGGWGGMQQKEPTRWTPSDPDSSAAIAVHITGTMPSAYPKVDGVAEAQTDGDATPAQPSERVGVPSGKPINVVVVADSDFCNDMFFQFYRDVGKRFSQQEDLNFLKDLRNIQFAANLVDTLVGEDDLVSVRSRMMPIRKLTFIDQQIAQAQKSRGAAEDSAKSSVEMQIEIARAKLQETVAEIDKQTGLDAAAKANLKELTERKMNRELEVQIEGLNRQFEATVLEAKAEQQSSIAKILTQVKALAVVVPFIFLAGIALIVYLRRVMRERTHVPAARARSNV